MRSVLTKRQRLDLSTALRENASTIYAVLVVCAGLSSILFAISEFGDQSISKPVYVVFLALYVLGDLFRLSFLEEATISLGFSVLLWTLLIGYPSNSKLAALLVAALGSLASETLWCKTRSERRLPWVTIARRALFYAGHHAVAGLGALLAYQYIHERITTPFLKVDVIHLEATLAYTVTYSLISMLLVWPHDRWVRLFLTADETHYVRVDFLSTVLLLPIPVGIYLLSSLISGQTVETFIVLLILPLVLVVLFLQARSFTALEEGREQQTLRDEISQDLGLPTHMGEMTDRILGIMSTMVDFGWGAVYSSTGGKLELWRLQIRQGQSVIVSYDRNEIEKLEALSKGMVLEHGTYQWPLALAPGEGVLDQLMRDRRPRFFYHGLIPDTASEPRLPGKTATMAFPIETLAGGGPGGLTRTIGSIILTRPKKPFTKWDWDRGHLLSGAAPNSFLRVQDLESRVQEICQKVEGFAQPSGEMQIALQRLVAQGVEVDKILGSVSEDSLRENLQAVLQSAVEAEADARSLITSDRLVRIYNRVQRETAEPRMPPPDQDVLDLLQTVTSYLPPAFLLYYQSPDVAREPALKAVWAFILAALEAKTVPDMAAQEAIVRRTIQELRGSSLTNRDKIIEKLEHFQGILVPLQGVEDAVSETQVVLLYEAFQSLRQSIVSVQDDLRDPEQSMFARVATTWHQIVRNAYYAAREKRTQLNIALVSNRILPLEEAVIQLRLENMGPGPAVQAHAQIQASEDYWISGTTRSDVGPLPVGSVRKLDFRIRPKPDRDLLTLKFQVSYQDLERKVIRELFVDRVYLREELEPFSRIEKVYVAGPALARDSALFFGREQVFNFVSHNLAAPTEIKPILLLIGARRMGKTSILKQLPQRLKGQNYIPVFFDCQRILRGGETDFFWRLYDSILEGLKAAELPVEDLTLDLESQPQVAFESEFLPKALELIGDRSLLFAIDEFEELYQRVREGRLPAEVFAYLRALMQSQKKMAFILVGAPYTVELISHYESALFNLAKCMTVSFLDSTDAKRLIVEPVAPYGMVYDDLALEEILRLTGCHPYLLQMACDCLVDHCNIEKRNYVTIQDVRRVQDQIIERGRSHLQFVWVQSSPIEKAVLSALVSLLHYEEFVSAADIVTHLSERVGNLAEGADFSLLSVTQALEVLTSREIIRGTAEPSAPRYYGFAAHLYQAWVSKYKSLEWIVPELVPNDD